MSNTIFVSAYMSRDNNIYEHRSKEDYIIWKQVIRTRYISSNLYRKEYFYVMFKKVYR